MRGIDVRVDAPDSSTGIACWPLVLLYYRIMGIEDLFSGLSDSCARLVPGMAKEEEKKTTPPALLEFTELDLQLTRSMVDDR